MDKMCGDDLLTKKLFEQSTLEDIEAIELIIDIFICDAKIQATIEYRDKLLELFAEKGSTLAIPKH